MRNVDRDFRGSGRVFDDRGLGKALSADRSLHTNVVYSLGDKRLVSLRLKVVISTVLGHFEVRAPDSPVTVEVPDCSPNTASICVVSDFAGQHSLGRVSVGCIVLRVHKHNLIFASVSILYSDVKLLVDDLIFDLQELNFFRSMVHTSSASLFEFDRNCTMIATGVLSMEAINLVEGILLQGDPVAGPGVAVACFLWEVVVAPASSPVTDVGPGHRVGISLRLVKLLVADLRLAEVVASEVEPIPTGFGGLEPALCMSEGASVVAEGIVPCCQKPGLNKRGTVVVGVPAWVGICVGWVIDELAEAVSAWLVALVGDGRSCTSDAGNLVESGVGDGASNAIDCN